MLHQIVREFMETIDRIKQAGLKLTPQRKVVYEVMMELRHASMDTIIPAVQERDSSITVSTIYRVVESFINAKILSSLSHPGTGKTYYDITVEEHHHVFSDEGIVDFDDPNLTKLIAEYLTQKNIASEDINRIQVQIIMNK